MNDETDLGGGIHVERVIGSGAMAMLLRAHRPDGSPVAVKLLLPKLMAHAEITERFVREGRAMAHLRSPHLPEILALGATESGQPFIVMELLEGEDLESLLASGRRLSVREAAHLVLEACEGVAVAHEAGIVHRDIKPSNLFLARSEAGKSRVVLLDFGIAKLPRERSEKGTAVGLVMGTSLYMAPEQVQSSTNVDARADVWALGVVLFELLTHELPFDGATQLDVLQAISNDPAPRLSSLFGDVPRELEDLVDKCLAKDPAERFQSVRELARALEPFASREADYGPLFAEPVRDDAPWSVSFRTEELPLESGPRPRDERVALAETDVELAAAR
jgi:serine/threonine-protein kinase